MKLKGLLLISLLGVSGCAWQTAAVVVPVVTAALIGPKIATDYYYKGHNATLRDACDESGKFTDCEAYTAAVQACYAHLGLFATDASKKNCEG